LETVDATREVLASIEASGTEGDIRFEELTERLRDAAQLKAVVGRQPAPIPTLQTDSLESDAAAPENKEVLKALELTRPITQPAAVERRKQLRTEEEEFARPSVAADANIRVGVLLLDKLTDLVGELVLKVTQW
jgi:chemotaxis protein histidine kinase CheA